MKDFDNSLIAQIISEEAITFWMIDFKVSATTTYYYSTLDINVVYSGNTYTPYEFTIKPINQSSSMSVDRVNVEFASVNLGMSAILLNNTVQGYESTIRFGVFSSDGGSILLEDGTGFLLEDGGALLAEDSTGGEQIIAEELFSGIANEWTIDVNKANISFVSEFVYWNKKTLRKHGALCSWVFKGTECTYSGAATQCNKSYKRCIALGNTNQFGGFRFLPSIEEKEIWWGKKPA